MIDSIDVDKTINSLVELAGRIQSDILKLTHQHATVIKAIKELEKLLGKGVLK